ncbi:MAG TPA: phosphodiesterase [Allosphingosinicella sp.]|nr:phosphodiesterase [Allosphingosinicella sp.]
MLVAQITDLHLGFDPGNPEEYNRQRLDQTLKVLASMTPRPDLLLVTGDIADNGDDRDSYERFKAATADLPFRVCPAMGNHDNRAIFREVFPGTPAVDGYIQYVVEDLPVRIIVLDTLEIGRHGGGFDEVRARWLEARLAEAPERPTLIVLHHPPIATGLSWMTENPEARWVKKLRPIVEANRNIVAMVCGHLHRPIVTRWAGTALAVCPSTAPQVALDMQKMDADHPDERPMIVADRPFFALHYWNGDGLITHFETVEEHEVLARFNPRRQGLIRMLNRERAIG